MTTIILKKGSGVPPDQSIQEAELAIDATSGNLYSKLTDGTVRQINGGSGDGAGMVIQPDEPTDPVTGLQWMDSTTGRIWIWDEDKWLEFPAGGSADAGDSDSVGGAWEVLERVEIGGAEMYEFDEFPDTHERFRVVWEFVDVAGFAANHAPYGYVKLDGSTDIFKGIYDTRVFLPTQWPNQQYDYFPLADWTNSGNPYGAYGCN